MAGQRKCIRNIQKALKQKGYIITISNYEFYSSSQDRFIRGYEVRRGKKVMFNSCSQIKTLKWLVILLSIIKKHSREQIESRKFNTVLDKEMERIWNDEEKNKT